MSVYVIGRVDVDPAAIKKLWDERPADFADVSADARSQGCTSHVWGFGDGYVTLIDEWPDAGTFQQFFSSNQKIPELMAAAGVTAEPKFDIVEVAVGPDTF